MRYRENGADGAPGVPVTEDVFVAVGAFGIVLGIGFVIAGVRGRQRWLAAWGGTLVLCSVVYVGGWMLGFA